MASSIDNRWYDRLGAAWWERRGPLAALHELNPLRASYVLAAIRDALPAVARRRVLDVGCGGGLLAEALASGGCEVVGLDASLPSLQAARTHAGGEGPAYLGGDAAHLPFLDRTFDAVVASEVLEHLDHPPALIEEAARVLRPGGVLLFSTPNRTLFARLALVWGPELLRWTPRRTHEYRRFIRPRELEGLLAVAGLEAREVRGIGLARPAPLAAWGYLRRRELGGFRLTGDLRFDYIGYAVLAAAVAPAREAVLASAQEGP